MINFLTHALFIEINQVFNPCIEPGTGILDLRHHIPFWNPQKHHMSTVLAIVKNIFHMKDFTKLPSLPNFEAVRLREKDPEIYLKNVQVCGIRYPL